MGRGVSLTVISVETGRNVSGLMRDLRIAIRRALRPRETTLLVCSCLALGTGVVTTVASVLESVLADSIPFDRPGQLYRIYGYERDRSDPSRHFNLTWAAYSRVLEAVEALPRLGAFAARDLDLYRDGETVRVPGAVAIPGSFSALGVSPSFGRDLQDGDARAGRRTALVSTSLAIQLFGQASEAVGQTIEIRGATSTIVGVVPDRRAYPLGARLWMAMDWRELSERERLIRGFLQVVGRRVESRTPSDVTNQLAAVAGELEKSYPDIYQGESLEALPFRDTVVGTYAKTLWTTLAASLLVLLIAVTNAVSLVAVRQFAGRSDTAVEIALGASHARIVRQALLGNTVIVGAGVGAGLLLAQLLLPWAVRLLSAYDPVFQAVHLSGAAMVVDLVVWLSATVLLAIPSGLAARSGVSILAGGRRSRGPSRQGARLQGAFVGGQVAVAVVLFLAASVLTRSLSNLLSVDTGMEIDRLATIRVQAPPRLQDTHDGRIAFIGRILERAKATPGVSAAGAASDFPVLDGESVYVHSVEDLPPETQNATRLAVGRVVTPGFFDATGIPVLRGRAFTPVDRLDGTPVVIVSQSLADAYWPGEDAIGKRLKRGAYDDPDRPWLQVVGIVGEVRGASDLGVAPSPAMYLPAAQTDEAYLATMTLVVRTPGRPGQVLGELARSLRAMEPRAVVFRPMDGPAVLGAATARARFGSLVLLLFGGGGLCLAAAGVFGMASYVVGRRSSEFGLRLALGDVPVAIMRRVLAQTVAPAAIGVGLGLVGAVVLGRSVAELLFEVEPWDPQSLFWVTLTTLGLVSLAALLAARKATRVDPADALRR